MWARQAAASIRNPWLKCGRLLQKLETKKNPFYGEVEALRKVSWVQPKLVAEIEYAEWTGGTNSGSSPKLRAPVFLGLRDDKNPKECLLEESLPEGNAASPS